MFVGDFSITFLFKFIGRKDLPPQFEHLLNLFSVDLQDFHAEHLLLFATFDVVCVSSSHNILSSESRRVVFLIFCFRQYFKLMFTFPLPLSMRAKYSASNFFWKRSRSTRSAIFLLSRICFL